jgi:hypothetical protein
VVERAEKQTILAKHARRLLNYVDDTPVVPGDARQAYEHEMDARAVLEDAEMDLRNWRPSLEPIASSADQEVPVHGNGVPEHVPDESESIAHEETSTTEKQMNERVGSEAQTVPLAS